jgi:hypothetical protein
MASSIEQDAEFVKRVRSELERPGAMDNEAFRLDVTENRKAGDPACVRFTAHKRDGSAQSSEYRIEQGQAGRVKITKLRNGVTIAQTEGSWSRHTIDGAVSNALMECDVGHVIPWEIDR